MIGWIVAGLLWAMTGPFVFASFRAKDNSDADLAWLFYIIWPLVVLAAWIAGIWFRIIYRGK